MGTATHQPRRHRNYSGTTSTGTCTAMDPPVAKYFQRGPRWTISSKDCTCHKRSTVPPPHRYWLFEPQLAACIALRHSSRLDWPGSIFSCRHI